MLSLLLGFGIAYGLHAHGVFAQTVSYAPGLEGQIWQQLPTFGRGVDMGNERPITTAPLTTAPTFSTPAPLDGLADVWPCTTDSYGFPALCYASGTIGVGEGAAPNVMQTYGGRFAPCVLDQCYPSGLVGVGPAITWAFGPCTMQSGANGTDCFPSGTVGAGPRVPPANGQLAGPLGIAVDNTPDVGTIYVTDHWNHRVQAFLFDGTVVPLAHPIGNGVLGSGEYTQDIGGQTVTGEQLSFPESIKVDASRQIIVADSGNGRVAVFDTDGNLIDSLTILDPASSVDGTIFAFPTGVALTPGASFRGTANPPGSRLVVTDKYNCTVYFFDATTLAQLGVAGGVQCADWGETLDFGSVTTVEGATLDNGGHAYVADYDRNRIEIFDAMTATLIGAFGDPLDGAVPPFALNGPTDVMVDHQGLYTETDAQGGTHQVARVFVVDTLNQRIAAYKVNFDQATPVATFLFQLNAAGDLNGFPTNIAEDTSRDPAGKLVTTDSGNARIQRFQVPDLAVVNVVPEAATQTVSFDVVVPSGKDPVGVTAVTPIVCPTSADTSVSSGAAAAQPGCATARSLAPTALITPGQSVTYSFQFASGQNTATFDIFATGNPFNNVPQTTSNHASATVTNSCPTCGISVQVVVPPLPGTLEALTPPEPGSTTYIGARIYTTQVSARVTATSPIGLSEIVYQFISGPETANNAQPGLHTVTVSPAGATSAFVDVPFRIQGTSVVEFWAKNTDGTEIAHGQAQLTLVLIPPSLTFRFDLATSSNASHANAAGWWNKAVALPLDFTGHITAVTPLGAGMPPNPPLSSPLSFTTEGRNLGFTVTVADTYGLSNTKSSNDLITEGQPFNIDMTAPVFVASPALTLERASFAGAPPLGGGSSAALALATDPSLTNGDAGSGVASVAPGTAVANFAMGASSSSFIATDAAGNTASGAVTVNVVDTVPPVLTCPATLDVQAGTLGTVFSQPGFLVSDASMIGAPVGAAPVSVGQSHLASFALPFLTTVSVTLTATDPSGNSSQCTTSVTGKLLAPPYFTRVPAAQTIEAGATPDLTATAVDSAGTSLTVTNNKPPTFPLGVTTVTFTATDLASQTVTATVDITMVDTTKPVIAAHGAVTVEATSGAGAVPSYTPPDVTDNFDATGPATCAPAPSATFALGNTTVTCNATDTSGNAANPTTFVVSVVDTTKPVIAAHADVTAEATSSAGAVVTYTSPATSDAVDGLQTAACLPASGTAFAFGNTTVTCSITDAHGNVATPTTFVVHVVDTTAPVIAPHPDVTVAPTSPTGAVVTYTAPATSDAFDGAKTATCTPASGTTFAIGDTTVTCRITDAHGNVALPTTFVVHVVDTTAPVVTVPANMTIEAIGPNGAPGTFVATAIDNTGSLATTCVPASGSTFQLGTTVVICSATDSSGNRGQASFNITVVDTTPPAVAVPVNFSVPSDGANGTTVTFTSSAIDLVSGAVATTCTPASGSIFQLGPTTVTCNATDTAGNLGTASFVVTVADVTKPVVQVPANMTIEATGPGGAVATFTATATDDVTTALTTMCSPVSGSTFALGTRTVTCSATDAAGNTGSASFTVTVVDTTAPVIAPHADVTVSPTSAAGAVVNYTVPTTTDAVDGIGSATCSPAPGALFAIGDRTVTCTATDVRGNAAVPTTFAVHVVDTTAPVITACSAPVTIFTTPGTPNALPNLTGGVTAADLSGFTVTQSPAAGTLYTLPSGQNSLTVPVTLTVTDGSPAHNASSCIATVTLSASSTPVCTAASAGGDLWPPNHKLATIGISGITNADGKPVTTTVTSIFQDEPTQGLGDGDTSIDGYIVNGVAKVRAERSGQGNGRVYYLNFTATSTSGSACTGTVSVGVPHDQAHPAVGGGPLFDSRQ